MSTWPAPSSVSTRRLVSVKLSSGAPAPPAAIQRSPRNTPISTTKALAALSASLAMARGSTRGEDAACGEQERGGGGENGERARKRQRSSQRRADQRWRQRMRDHHRGGGERGVAQHAPAAPDKACGEQRRQACMCDRAHQRGEGQFHAKHGQRRGGD